MLRLSRFDLAARAGACAFAVLALAGCPPRHDARAPAGAGNGFTGCLPLTGTSRAALRLGPGGSHLYWTEQVRLHGYEDAWPSTEVVRWPLAGGPVERLTNLLENPYRVLGDGRVVGVRKDAGVAVWGPAGSELVSLSGTVDHLELLGSEQAVVYREGESIWRQAVHRQAATWLGYADALLGVDGDTVYIRNRPPDDSKDRIYQVDAITGKVTELPYIEDVAKAVPGGLVIQNALGLGVRAPDGGEVKPAATGEGWQIRVGPEAVKAWRKVGPRLDGVIITGAGADPVPPVLGADSLEGFVRVPDGRVAYLIGHDLDGDGEVTTGDEVDVCLARADSKEVKVEPRGVPTRWRQGGEVIATLVKDRLGGGTWHFAAGDAVPGLTIKTPRTRADRAAMWADVREFAAAVAAATGDDTMFIDITYGDDKRAFSEWWAGTGRRVAWAGTGGATVPDLADYDALITTSELEDIVDGDEDSDSESGDGSSRARCAGSVKNTSDHVLVEMVADCVSGTDDEPIEVEPPNLAPGQIGHFAGFVHHASGANLAVSVHSGNGRDEIAGFAEDRHARYVKLDQVADLVLDRTRLIYRDASANGGSVAIHLSAPDDFDRWSGQAQELATGTAQDVLEKAGGELFGGAATDKIRLRITAGDSSWTFEDGHLTAADD